MVDVGILIIIIWVGCFVVLSIDSVYQGISPVFWRFATLFGGRFALLGYNIVRSKTTNS